MTKIAGSGVGSGSVSQRYGSADPDQNVTDPQHWFVETVVRLRPGIGLAHHEELVHNIGGGTYPELANRNRLLYCVGMMINPCLFSRLFLFMDAAQKFVDCFKLFFL